MTIYAHGHILTCDVCAQMATSYEAEPGQPLHAGCEHHPVHMPATAAQALPWAYWGQFPPEAHVTVPLVTAV